MKKPYKKRYCRRLDKTKIFYPLGMEMKEDSTVRISLDEFEAMRLCDFEGKNQTEASQEMKVSRATLQRLLQTGRKKTTDALLNYKTIVLENETEHIQLKGENNMNKEAQKSLKIALPTTDKQKVDEHFGHCKFFAVYQVEDNQILETSYLEAPVHAPGVLPKFLGENKVDVIITGGMGQMAINLFKQQNIEVILGAQGSIDENLKVYMGGDLVSTGEACKHDHEH